MNFDNLIGSINIFRDNFQIGARRITVSTCGIIPQINKLADLDFQSTLAISLHAPNQSVRQEIMPVAKKYEFNELLSCLKKYTEKTGRRVTVEYVLMKDVNDSIENAKEAVYEEKKMEEMEVYFLMDRFGYAKTIDVPTYERNKEAVHAENKYVFSCKNTGRICIFTNLGQLHTFKVADLPFGKFRDKGVPIDNVSNFSSAKEELIQITSQSDLNLYRVVFATKQSMLKVVDGGEFDVAKRTVAATKLSEDDQVVSVEILKEQRNIVLQTKEGYFLRFPLEEIPGKKKGAVGVRGMKLTKDDYVEAVYFTQNAVEKIVTYKEKEIELNKLKLGKRDTKGVKVRV